MILNPKVKTVPDFYRVYFTCSKKPNSIFFNIFQVVPDENQPKSFGIKHSPYVGALKGDDWVSARTETVTTMPTSTLVTNGHNNSNTVVQNTSGGGSKVTSNTRTHSDGQRIRTETFSYTEPVRTVRTSTTTRSTQQVAA